MNDFLNMEGVLWKWTNYWHGWQKRWFVLENDVLTYYNSQEDVRLGCKGSVKIQVCNILVNPINNKRLDLIIPGEQYLYLRAATIQERQTWLLALGSAKAGFTNPEKIAKCVRDALHDKKSELRHYADMLMQQAHLVKKSAQEACAPDIEKMVEAANLLGNTCDLFIQTLGECTLLINEERYSDYTFQKNVKKCC